LAPKYFAQLETELVNNQIDDIAPKLMTIKKTKPASIPVTSISVRCVGTDDLVTVIELLSPINKYPGKYREQYEKNA
jgi:hypothetical protein